MIHRSSCNNILFHTRISTSSRLHSTAVCHSFVTSTVSTSSPVVSHLGVELLSSLRLWASSTATLDTSATTTGLSAWLTSLVSRSSRLGCSSSWLRLGLLRGLLDAVAEGFGGGSSWNLCSAYENFDLGSISDECRQGIVGVLAFIGRPSTFSPLSSLAAFAAPSALAKMMVATPRDSPFGPYERRTFLIAPTVVVKYSYERKSC